MSAEMQRRAELRTRLSPEQRARIWTEQEIENLGPREYEQLRDEIGIALQEGRIVAKGHTKSDGQIQAEREAAEFDGVPTFSEEQIDGMSAAERTARKAEIDKALRFGRIIPRGQGRTS
jgi:hypothetical protein